MGVMAKPEKRKREFKGGGPSDGKSAEGEDILSGFGIGEVMDQMKTMMQKMPRGDGTWHVSVYKRDDEGNFVLDEQYIEDSQGNITDRRKMGR